MRVVYQCKDDKNHENYPECKAKQVLKIQRLEELCSH